jgi:hypothetical protein
VLTFVGRDSNIVGGFSMAKHSRALTRFAPAPRVIVMAPPRRAGRIRRAGARVVHHARRAGRHVTKQHVASTAIIMSAAALGYAKQKGMLDQLPVIGGSKVLTLGLAGYVVTRFSKNPTVRNLGAAAMIAAAFDFGRVQGGGVAGEGEEGEGPLGGEEGAEY